MIRGQASDHQMENVTGLFLHQTAQVLLFTLQIGHAKAEDSEWLH